MIIDIDELFREIAVYLEFVDIARGIVYVWSV